MYSSMCVKGIFVKNTSVSPMIGARNFAQYHKFDNPIRIGHRSSTRNPNPMDASAPNNTPTPIQQQQQQQQLPLSSHPLYPTIDGSLGLSEEESYRYARRFFKFGFALLPFLWAVNCYYFWPVLRHSRSFIPIRPYVVGSAIGFSAFTILLGSWALTFAIGGERLFGSNWDKLVMYNVAEKIGLTGWA